MTVRPGRTGVPGVLLVAVSLAAISLPSLGGCGSAETRPGAAAPGGTGASSSGGSSSSGSSGAGTSTSSSGGASTSSSGGSSTSSSSGGASTSSSTGGASTSSSTSGSGTSSSTGGTSTSSSGSSSGAASYAIDPPDPCYNQYWVQGCQSGVPSSTCGGRCAVANACSPPESANKADLPKTFACPRFMLFSDEMKLAARDDAAAYAWGDPADPPFTYAVAGHDVDSGGLDAGAGSSTCCQCYQLVFDKPEPGSPQPPDLPVPKPMIVQSFNTAAGGGKNFDLFMGAGGFGAFNACVPGTYSGTQTTTFGRFMYDAFPSAYNGQGGVKFINLDACKVNGGSTTASLGSSACQDRIAQLCDAASSPSAATTRTTRASCKEGNLLASAYHQNWTVRARRVECPTALTRVTGCRLASAGLPRADARVRTVAAADASFLSGYTTTTMQDCCKPTCAWKDGTAGAGLTPSGPWTSFYSCDENGVPITAPAP